MKKEKTICVLLIVVGLVMILMAMILQTDISLNIEEVDIKNMAASSNMYVKAKESSVIVPVFEEIEMEVAPVSVDIPAKQIVYDNLTLEELAAKIDRNLGNGYIAGKGMLVANYCMEKGVDPYVATAIMLHETGCRSNCSNLVKQCNNVGGQKGSPGCNGGAYKRFSTLDEGIQGFINNLSKNYYSLGLDTIEKIAPKYAEGSAWPAKINWYVNIIKNS